MKLFSTTLSVIVGSMLIAESQAANISAIHPGTASTVYSGVAASSVTFQPQNQSAMLKLADELQAKHIYKPAIGLIEQAAMMGNAEAQFRLGNIYSQGEIVTENDEEALYWMERSAKQGHAQARFMLQLMADGDFGIGC